MTYDVEVMPPIHHEKALGLFLRDLPHEHGFRYTDASDKLLREHLFRSLIGDDLQRLPLLFPSGSPQDPSIAWSLRKAQGAVEGAEYTAAARGHPCGHIFKAGESTYHCKTCAADDTCVLCARCFHESDHEDHAVFISVSPGNSGCCDCADDEAWVRPVNCTIHKKFDETQSKAAGKSAQLPEELAELIRMTIGKALDYVCDVFSCSPEQLRLPKTEDSVMKDEREARLTSEKYGGPEQGIDPVEYALVLWNDEKHTVDDVQNQVARACKRTKRYGLDKANEVNEVGRSVVHYSTDLTEILRMATVIEQIKVTVTVRSARDTFREQMCDSIIDWISDIAGCSVGSDPHILRSTVCQQLLSHWQVGSQRSNAHVGADGIHDHESEDRQRERDNFYRWARPLRAANIVGEVGVEVELDSDQDDMEMDGEDDEEDDDEMGGEMNAGAIFAAQRVAMEILGEDAMDIVDDDGNVMVLTREEQDQMVVDMDDDLEDTAQETMEATLAGYPPPPPPPTVLSTNAARLAQDARDDDRTERVMTPQESDEGEQDSAQLDQSRSSILPLAKLPKTPKPSKAKAPKSRPPSYWLWQPGQPDSQSLQHSPNVAENLWEHVRLDYLILYDLRLWKTLRISLRHLYIGTVVTLPDFKRILGLRFAGLYTMLAQLYLIADREPEVSIINLSVQMLTTPSITAEVVERANFLTNLLAILYTFLTTRQVGYPSEVNPSAVLAFDAGAVTNRRMFHFFVDIRYMFQSTFVQEKIRSEPRYLLQFLDLVKLHQGICPNVRAVGEHVEYETDAWIGASMIIKEINRLCRHVADAYMSCPQNEFNSVCIAIRTTALATLINSFGLERKRFVATETKKEMRIHRVPKAVSASSKFEVPEFSVIKEHMSFHHPLHYLLSWLLEAGKSMPRDTVRRLLTFEPQDIRSMESATTMKVSSLVNLLSSPSAIEPSVLFDHPLRVCTWLAQMRAGMWVRNGMTLRHQMHTYRSTSQRDVSYQRDIFMLQAGLVLCGHSKEASGERFLAQMIDRFDLTSWTDFDFTTPAGYEEHQHVDVLEDFVHILVVLLSERGDLITTSDSTQHRKESLQREIAHVLCFKPLSFSDISTRLTDKVAESEGFDDVLAEMTRYRAPEGMSDSGTFELQPDYMALIDPYYAFYTRNQREEADNILKAFVSKKTGKPENDIVFEPDLPAIESGLFQDLAAFTTTATFHRFVSATLRFARYARSEHEKIASSRVETILNTTMHLVLLAMREERPMIIDADFAESVTFLERAVSDSHPEVGMLSSLSAILAMEEFASCHARIKLCLSHMEAKFPRLYAENARSTKDNRLIPAIQQPSDDREAKKRDAMARQARVLASFKQQQSSFMETQGLDWEVDDFSEGDEGGSMMTPEEPTGPIERIREYPAEPCMLCQEPTNDGRVFGAFAHISHSNILRQTDLTDPDFITEVINTPQSLDRSAEALRPFGVSAMNKYTIEKTSADGSIITQNFQGMSKGYPHHKARKGAVSTSCGHIMHFQCYEDYLSATNARHAGQIARNHPERPSSREFLCPLCKALGNVFLPIVWKGKKESYPGILGGETTPYDDWLKSGIWDRQRKLLAQSWSRDSTYTPHAKYVSENLATALAEKLLLGGSEAESTASVPTGTNGRASRSNPAIIARAAAILRQGLDASMAPLSGTSRASQPAPESTRRSGDTLGKPAEELHSAYEKVKESLIVNGIAADQLYASPSDLINVESLCETLAYSISAVEIAHRGVASPGTLLSSISDQSLTHLRILSETVSSYIAVGGLSGSGSNLTNRELELLRTRYIEQLLGQSSDYTLEKKTPLLDTDMFTFLTDCSFAFVGDWQTDGLAIMQSCYTAEIIRVITAVIVAQSRYRHIPPAVNPDQQEPLDRLVEHTMMMVNNALEGTAWTIGSQTCRPLPVSSDGSRHTSGLSIHDVCKAVRKMVESYALTFLRKCILLLHVRFGVDFAAAEGSVDSEATELERLSALLRLPSLIEIFRNIEGSSEEGGLTREMVLRWFQQASYQDGTRFSGLTISHPAIFELVGLPKTYDTLTEAAIKRRCPTTGKEVTDPAVCLFCGDIFCSQAGCCRKDGKGGCYQHLHKCGGNIGIFINIRKCMILFMHNGHGSWAYAPYLDKHGEVDATLRRHHQLFLNQRRYDKLFRDVWLNHGVPSAISRRLEGEVNTGGWETL